MQYRFPVGAGPSSKTWPRCESACVERTSVRTLKNLRSERVVMLFNVIGLVKLGQPVPDVNLSNEVKSGSPLTIST